MLLYGLLHFIYVRSYSCLDIVLIRNAGTRELGGGERELGGKCLKLVGIEVMKIVHEPFIGLRHCWSGRLVIDFISCNIADKFHSFIGPLY